jgi:hypothetical protein
MTRFEPNEEGKIPCICCNHKGERRNMITKEKYICDKCQGTKMRPVPIGYKTDKQIAAETAEEKKRQDEINLYCWETFIKSKAAKTNLERLTDIETVLYNAGLME